MEKEGHAAVKNGKKRGEVPRTKVQKSESRAEAQEVARKLRKCVLFSALCFSCSFGV
jgi:hypothetical protein